MPKRTLLPREHLFLRFLIAGCVWLIVSGISLETGWRNAQGSMAWAEQRETQLELKSLDGVITTYRQQFGSDPTNFEQMQSATNFFPWMEDHKFVDLWGHPLVFSIEGTNTIIISYGRDGKPGGVGVDCDLTTKNPKPKEAIPTLGQFWENERLHGMILTALACGALAALLSFVTVRVPNFTPRGLMVAGLSLSATFVGAVIVAGIITILHIPTGH
jgi:general secretion pathway protein G